MDTRGLIFRNLAVDGDVDEAVSALAKATGATKGSVYRLFIETGLAQLAQGAPLPPAGGDLAPRLKALHADYNADETLRVLAFKMRIPKDELGRRVVRLGMFAVQAAEGGVGMPESPSAGLGAPKGRTGVEGAEE